MSELYPALVPIQDSAGNLVADANGHPVYPGGVTDHQTIDLHTPQPILVTINGQFNVPGWNDGPFAQLRVVVSRYIGIGTFGYKHFPYAVTPADWHAESRVVSPAIQSGLISRPAVTQFTLYDRPVFAPCVSGGVVQCPSPAQWRAGWNANPWHDPNLYDSWVSAGMPQTVLADFHESSASGVQNFIDKVTNLPGTLVTSVVNAVEKAGQQVIDEVARIPGNIVDYVQNPRDLIQAAAKNLSNGWGLPFALLMGPASLVFLTAIDAGANAHTLGQFGEAIGRQASKGAAIMIASVAVGAVLPIDVSAINPLVLATYGAAVIPDDAVVAAAKVAQYFEQIVPFFPLALEELTIQAQQTESERDTLRLHLNALRAQIAANGGLWYTAAVDVCNLIVQVAVILSGVGIVFDIVKAALTVGGVALQMESANQTLVLVHQQQRAANAAAEAAAQKALDAINAQIAAINAQIAKLSAQHGQSTSTGQVPATTRSGTMLWVLGGAALLLLLGGKHARATR